MRKALGVVAIACTALGWRAQPPQTVPEVESDARVQQLERAATRTINPEAWYLLAAYCSDKSNEATLTRDVTRGYVVRGLEADDKALAINGVYYEAIVLKSVLLRQRAKYERDPSVRRRLAAEADVYSASAAEIAKRLRPPVVPPVSEYVANRETGAGPARHCVRAACAPLTNAARRIRLLR